MPGLYPTGLGSGFGVTGLGTLNNMVMENQKRKWIIEWKQGLCRDLRNIIRCLMCFPYDDSLIRSSPAFI